jgi:hybrid cluster-associated redox disulfide protein
MSHRLSTRIHPAARISELLRDYPATIPVFIRHRMVCVGCWMSKFDTIADAVWNYGLDMEEFLSELNNFIQSEPPQGESDDGTSTKYE